MRHSHVFQALADPCRFRIVELLRQSKSELCLCDFAQSLGEPDYKLSRHLKALKAAGLIQAKRDGKWIYHSLSTGTSAHKHLYLFLGNMGPSPDGAKDLARYVRLVKSRGGEKCQKPGSAKLSQAAP